MSNEGLVGSGTGAAFIGKRDEALPCGHTSGRVSPIHGDDLVPVVKNGNYETLLVCWCGATYQVTQRESGETGVMVPRDDVLSAGKEYYRDNRN